MGEVEADLGTPAPPGRDRRMDALEEQEQPGGPDEDRGDRRQPESRPAWRPKPTIARKTASNPGNVQTATKERRCFMHRSIACGPGTVGLGPRLLHAVTSRDAGLWGRRGSDGGRVRSGRRNPGAERDPTLGMTTDGLLNVALALLLVPGGLRETMAVLAGVVGVSAIFVGLRHLARRPADGRDRARREPAVRDRRRAVPRGRARDLAAGEVGLGARDHRVRADPRRVLHAVRPVRDLRAVEQGRKAFGMA